MNAAHQRSLTPVLVVTTIVLGSLLLLLLGGIGSKVHWNAPRSLPPLPSAGNAASLPVALPLEQFAVVWQKPLFSPDRKPVTRMASAGAGLGLTSAPIGDPNVKIATSPYDGPLSSITSGGLLTLDPRPAS